MLKLPAVTQQKHIPKQIFQCFFPNKADLPNDLLANIEQIKSMNPGWSHEIFDENDIARFIQKEYGQEWLDCFSKINPRYGAARADFFRYLLLYKRGGFYLDIKSSLSRPLDEVIRDDDQFLISTWNNGVGQSFENWGCHAELAEIAPHGEFQQWQIACVAGHKFMREVVLAVARNIESYDRRLHGTGKPGVLRVTGPVMYTRTILPLLDPKNHRMVDSEHELGFIYSIYSDTKHKALFKRHYSNLTEPIVYQNPMSRYISNIHILSKRIANRIIRPLRG